MKIAYVNDKGKIQVLLDINENIPGIQVPPANPGETAVLAPFEVSPKEYRFDFATDQFISIGFQPTRWHTYNWDTLQWEDTGGTYDEKLQVLRSEARLTKLDFLQGAVSSGFMNSFDAAELSMNRITPSVEAVIGSIEGSDKDLMLIEWASKVEITRNDRLIVQLAQAALAEQHLDNIFGVDVAASEVQDG